jgi:hypothetical protein
MAIDDIAWQRGRAQQGSGLWCITNMVLQWWKGDGVVGFYVPAAWFEDFWWGERQASQMYNKAKMCSANSTQKWRSKSYVH